MQSGKRLSNGNHRSVLDNLVGDVSSDSSNLSPVSTGVKYIEHHVSKMDTLAGVAIKYGVEVADIKRLNGLVTDFQMFAHKTLLIPLPGRHPPSPILSNGSASPGESRSERSTTRRPHIDVLDSFQSLKLKSPQRKVSPAMSSLQGYYGLTPSNNNRVPEGTEMAVFKLSNANYLEDSSQLKMSPASDQPPGHWKSKSLVNGQLPENGLTEGSIDEAGDNEADRSSEKVVRRRQKTDNDPSCRTPELLLKEDSSSGFSGAAGKGLALRTKSASRSSLMTDAESGRLNPIPMGDSLVADGLTGVRKSSSTSNLQDSSENSSIWPTTKWNLKPDLQALSAAAITRPIFDGLPKPITGRRKAALD